MYNVVYSTLYYNFI